jgi:hypothetical protein
VVLAVALSPLIGSPALGHDRNDGQDDRIEGAWNVVITALDTCGPNGAPLIHVPVMKLFSQGGTLTEVAGTTSLGPTPDVRVNPGLGTWQHVRGGRYTVLFRFFRVDEKNLPAGSHRLTESIELDRDGDSFTGTGIAQQFNNLGNFVFEQCFLLTGTRLEKRLPDSMQLSPLRRGVS